MRIIDHDSCAVFFRKRCIEAAELTGCFRLSAEQRIATLEAKKDEVVDDTTKKLSALGLIIIIVSCVLGAALITVAIFFIIKYKEKIAAFVKTTAAKAKAKLEAKKAAKASKKNNKATKADKKAAKASKKASKKAAPAEAEAAA